MIREEAIKELKEYEDGLDLEYATPFDKAILYALKALEQENITWIVGNDNVQIAVRNMPVDMMQKINAIIGNKQEPATKNDLAVDWESYKDADGNSLDDLILEVLQNNFDCGNTYGYKVADEIIGLLPSVTPQEPKCKDCKWWKDSDGEYRRGCGAESQCPINRKEVYEGNGYCFLYEPQENEQ